jgi:hypothetical protein
VENVVDPEALRFLRRLGADLGYETIKKGKRDLGMLIPEDTSEAYHLFGHKFVLGKNTGVRTKCSVSDKEDILRQVQEAARQAEWVIVSLHAHEGMHNIDRPPEFVIDFARSSIEAGAHVFVGHGAHIPRGIEIYKGRPIFYELGVFVLQVESIPRVTYRQLERYGLGIMATPSEYIARTSDDERLLFPSRKLYWETILPVCRWNDSLLRKIEIYPVELGHGSHWGARGRPMIARPDVAKEILERYQKQCALLGTRMAVSEGIGVIEPE